MDINKKIEKYLVEEKIEESEDGAMGYFTGRSPYRHNDGSGNRGKTITCPRCKHNFGLEDQ